MHSTRQGDEFRYIKDEGDPTVAENRSPSNALGLPEICFKTFDHDLLLSEESIDEDGHVLTFLFDDDDEAVMGL
jgi:hypothetical protein